MSGADIMTFPLKAFGQEELTINADSIESRICLAGYVNNVYKQFVYTNRSNVSFDTIPEIYTLTFWRN